jgi:hypothetical protein
MSAPSDAADLLSNIRGDPPEEIIELTIQDNQD